MTILECSIFPLEGLGKGQMYQCRSRRGGGEGHCAIDEGAGTKSSYSLRGGVWWGGEGERLRVEKD